MGTVPCSSVGSVQKTTYSKLGFLQIAKNIFPWLPERGTGLGNSSWLFPAQIWQGSPGLGLGSGWHRAPGSLGSRMELALAAASSWHCSPLLLPSLGSGVCSQQGDSSCSGSFPSSQFPLQCFSAAHKPGAATSPPRTFSSSPSPAHCPEPRVKSSLFLIFVM